MKLLVCGTRSNYNYSEAVYKKLDELKPSRIIEGCCSQSADIYAEEWAKRNNIPISHYPGAFSRESLLARDRQMVEYCDEVLAFWDGKSRGTGYTVAYAKKLGKPVRIEKIILSPNYRRDRSKVRRTPV